jgi:hypothetical protein
VANGQSLSQMFCQAIIGHSVFLIPISLANNGTGICPVSAFLWLYTGIYLKNAVLRVHHLDEHGPDSLHVVTSVSDPH